MIFLHQRDEYDYQIWKKEFGANMSGVLPPEQAQVAYNLTYYCSSIQLQIQKKNQHLLQVLLGFQHFKKNNFLIF